MSFSKSFVRNDGESAKTIIDATREEVTKNDASYSSEGMKAGHSAQLDAAEVALGALLDRFPAIGQGSVYGHAGDDSSGNVGISYIIAKAPTP